LLEQQAKHIKMRAAAVATTTLSLLTSLVSARIWGIAVPSTVAVDSTVELKMLTIGYIQPVQDVAIAFGTMGADGAYLYPDATGTLLSERFLGQCELSSDSPPSHLPPKHSIPTSSGR
jgi:hypothetical protein